MTIKIQPLYTVTCLVLTTSTLLTGLLPYQVPPANSLKTTPRYLKPPHNYASLLLQFTLAEDNRLNLSSNVVRESMSLCFVLFTKTMTSSTYAATLMLFVLFDMSRPFTLALICCKRGSIAIEYKIPDNAQPCRIPLQTLSGEHKQPFIFYTLSASL